jgi:hypothetical protein
MPSEYRYLLKTTQTINGLTAKKLSTQSQSGTYESIGASKGSAATTVYMGIRVWKRASDGTETEITAGTPVAQVSTTTNRTPAPPLSATWNCPSTTLAATDSIVVRFYTKFDAGSWILLQTCTTEQLGAQSLDAATWTVIYYFEVINISINATSNLYYDGDVETLYYYPTDIQNFTWTPAAAPPVKKPIMNGLVYVE